MSVHSQSINPDSYLISVCGIGRFIRVPFFQRSLICHLPRYLLYFEEDFPILKRYFPVSSQIKSFLFSLFPFCVTQKHTVVSHIHSNTHIHAAVSMRALFVQCLDQFGEQVTSQVTSTLDSQVIPFPLQLLTVNNITQHKVQISTTY